MLDLVPKEKSLSTDEWDYQHHHQAFFFQNASLKTLQMRWLFVLQAREMFAYRGVCVCDVSLSPFLEYFKLKSLWTITIVLLK